MKFDQTTKEKIKQKIEEKGALRPCERCGQPHFSVLDGFINLPLTQEVSGNVIIGGPQVPCAVIGCNNCGNLSYFALGALGLLVQNKGVAL